MIPTKNLVLVCWSFGAILSIAQDTAEAQFEVTVETEKKPWSHLNFRNDPDNFQFAIVTDRTGGLRPGVFPEALKRLNLLEPEFVITVGDLIVGNRKTTDEGKVHEMWDEMETFVGHLDMPFFYLAGNHDNGSPLLSKVWKERFGVERYSFVYKNVLFLCLNAQDTQQFPAQIEKEQQEWAIKTLEEHPDVRWTFVFIHQPVWMYEEGIPIAEADHTLPARETGWKPIEAALQGRPHTAFAGHVHQYVKYSQKDPTTNYYSLATMGAGNKLRGVDFGEFDHATWVTLTDDGPKIANLLIDGILPEDVNTREAELFRGLVSMTGEFSSEELPVTVNVEFKFENSFSEKLTGHCDWEIPVLSGWKANPPLVEIDLSPGERIEQKFQLIYSGTPRKVNPLPVFHIGLTDEDQDRYVARQTIPVDFTAFYERHNIQPLLTAKEKAQKAKGKARAERKGQE